MKDFEFELGLTLAAIVATLVIVNAFHGFHYSSATANGYVETLRNPPTVDERISQVIEDCRHELQADGACLAYDYLRRRDPDKARKLVADTPELLIYDKAITKIESGH